MPSTASRSVRRPSYTSHMFFGKTHSTRTSSTCLFVLRLPRPSCLGGLGHTTPSHPWASFHPLHAPPPP